MNLLKLRKVLNDAYIEDIGEGDLTSTAIFPATERGTGKFIAKESGVLSGLDILKVAYDLFDPSIQVTLFFQDGQFVNKGETIAEVNGPMRHLLTAERVILNLVQRMSGIATITRKSIETLNDPQIHICDTRKTVPGLRMLDKYAVKCGGGKNHRIGLYDGVMIKDNHIAFCGSISKAVQMVRERIGHMVKIEVETETKAQVLEAVEANADVIMFDNCAPQVVKEYSSYVPKHIITEVSGGITLANLAKYQYTDVNYISLGYLTHSVKALDISFLV